MNDIMPLFSSPASAKNDIGGLLPLQATVPVSKPSSTKSKPRKRVNTAEKRHQHNAIERQRRESLNTKFLSLARLIPALAPSRRPPSKSVIVNGSISHLTHQRDQRLLAAKLLREMSAERTEMLDEINQWRKANGFAPKQGLNAFAEEIDQVCTVEKEVFGNFASMGGDGDDDDDDMSNDMNLVDRNINAAPMSSGSSTITYSGSTDFMGTAKAPAVYPDVPVIDQRQPTATVNGLNWSNEFAYSVNSAKHNDAPLPFSGYLSDSSSASPTHSQPALKSAHGSVYAQSTSPRSSNGSFDDHVAIGPKSQQSDWGTEQSLFLQQHPVQPQQQQVQPQRQQQSQQVYRPPAYDSGAMYPSSQQLSQTYGPGADPFTQSMLASMFPPNAAATTEQIEQWRDIAVGGYLGHGQPAHLQGTQVQSLEHNNTGGIGLDLGFGMAGGWPGSMNSAVEGF